MRTDGSRITYDRGVHRFQGSCSQVQLPDGQFTDADGKLRQPAFHDLRRTFARIALRSGMSQSGVMLVAGWKTPVMLRRYLGSNKEGQRQALAGADKVLGTGSVPSSALIGTHGLPHPPDGIG